MGALDRNRTSLAVLAESTRGGHGNHSIEVDEAARHDDTHTQVNHCTQFSQSANE